MNNDNVGNTFQQNQTNFRRKFIVIFIVIQLFFYFYFQIQKSALHTSSSTSSPLNGQLGAGGSDHDSATLGGGGGGENIFDDVHSHQYKRDQEYNYNYNQNRIRLNIMLQEDSPYNFILAEIAALVYFDFVFHSSLVQERNYFNMLAWDTKFASFGDRFKKNEKIYFRFLFPKEENMILRVSSNSKKVGGKLDSEEYNRWDSRLSLSQQESFLKHFIQMTFGSKGFSLAYSEDYKLGHLEEENVHFKHLQKSYMQSIFNNDRYTRFLKSFRLSDKIQQESNHDKQREESIFINHRPKDKFSDYSTIHITDLLNMDYGTTMEVESIELIQQHFENLLETSTKKQKRLKYAMKSRALNYVLFYLNQQNLLPILNQTKFEIDEETSHLKGKDLGSIYLVLASSPDWIRSWFTYKVRSADTNALRHSSKKKVLLNKLMASIKQKGHSKHSQIHYVIRFWIQGHCDTYCRLNVIKTYHYFKELQSNFPNIFNFSVLFNVDESVQASLYISIEKEEQVSPIINHLNCKKSCVKEIVLHHEKAMKKLKKIEVSASSSSPMIPKINTISQR